MWKIYGNLIIGKKIWKEEQRRLKLENRWENFYFLFLRQMLKKYDEL